MFDLHRLRHIVEPAVTLWHASSNVTQGALPVYDPRVEGINTGTAARFGLKQTWQTYRGGPGRWRSVDVFVLNTDYVWASSDSDRTSPIGRWVDARPEYSVLGEYFTADALWQTTDALAMTGFWSTTRSSPNSPPRRSAPSSTSRPDLHLRRDPAHRPPGLDAARRRREWLLSAALARALAVFDLDEGNVQSVGIEIERRFSRLRSRSRWATTTSRATRASASPSSPCVRGVNRDRAPIGRTILRATGWARCRSPTRGRSASRRDPAPATSRPAGNKPAPAGRGGSCSVVWKWA